MKQVLKFRTNRPNLRYILLDARGINDMDASGEEALSLLVKRVRSAGLGFCDVRPEGPGHQCDGANRPSMMKSAGKNLYADSRAAISALVEILHKGTDLPTEGCANCPPDPSICHLKMKKMKKMIVRWTKAAAYLKKMFCCNGVCRALRV